MFVLSFTEAFDKSFSKIRDKQLQTQVWNKVKELEGKAPLGKKLKGNQFWSIHVNRLRVIYQMDGNRILLVEILERKNKYREL